LVHLESWDVERGVNGAVLVRVHSHPGSRERLPDAVFTFRVGDPQYSHWERMLQERLAERNSHIAAEAGIR
jgi:hypothetical protein